MSNLEDRMRDLDVIPAPDLEFDRHRPAGSSMPSDPAQGSTLRAIVSCSISVIVLVVLVSTRQGATPSMRPVAGSGLPASQSTLRASGVCGASDGTPVSLGDASTASGFTLFAVADPSDVGQLRKAVSCPGGEVVLEFSSGANIYENANKIADPGAAWQSLAADSSDTTVATIQGQPAALTDPAKSHAFGSVSVVLDGTWIVVEGNGSMDMDALVRAASGLSPYSATS
jgi:hypothetical protein